MSKTIGQLEDAQLPLSRFDLLEVEQSGSPGGSGKVAFGDIIDQVAGDALGLIGAAALQGQTTNATPLVLTTDGAAAGVGNQLALVDDSAVVVTGKVVGRQNSTGDSTSWTFACALKRGSGVGTTALVGTATVTSVGAASGAAAWVLAVTADATHGALAVTVTGEAAKSIKWAASIEACVIAG